PEAGTSVDVLSLALVACLASPDPELRDDLAYALLTRWMRAGAVSDASLHTLSRVLVEQLDDGLGQVGQDSVFRRAFSALVLSEVIRRDTLQPFLTPKEASDVLAAAVRYLETEKDLRGFSDTRGWAHGVAHGADLLWRLAMSPRMKAPELERILMAVASKVAPPGHAYIHNESDRLARVVVAVLHRGLVPPQSFARWLEQVASPGELKAWGEAFRSEQGLARLHDTKQFLRALHTLLVLGSTPPPAREQLLPLVVGALQKVSLV
ncbi:MAG TPA: DUF2785 domain-containing protein, partial [Myxococcaceae bacterium]|nr:DUF2785 domain-containing protein [Myxococcaceae bacterium]